MSLSKKAGTASLLLLIRRVWGAGVTFLVMAYLARELSTEDFGILAISTVLIEFISTVVVSGISEYAIFYNGDNKRAVLNAIFWFSLVASLLVILIVILLTPFWADYYGSEQIAPIVYLLLFAFVFQVLGEVPIAIFKKEINFKPLITIQMIFNILTNLGKVGLAFSGFGVFSLAIPTAVFAPLITITLFWKSGFFPKRDWGFKYWKSIIEYTKFVIGQRVLNRIVSQGDQLILGTFWGIDLLGVYALASQFANLVPSYFIPIIQNVTSPILAKNNHDLEKVKFHFKKVLRSISYACIPLLVLIIINAEYLVLTIYGPKWSGAVLPCQLIAAYLIIRCVTSPTAGLYNVLGKPKVGFYFTLAYVPIFLIALFLACSYLDFNEAIFVICLVKALGGLAHFIIVPRITNDKIASLFRVVLPIFMASGLGILATIPLTDYSGIFYFSIRSLIFMIVTFLSLRLIWKTSLSTFINDIKPMVPNRLEKLFWK
ncbi:oligosaccharide flippase family protein [Roseivirga sp. E12]|uniref:oligosaccharide flippase family protein n=1 Tax=Roseivirga sp. E12 TaxID=2819237 RepID=UPI001ABCE48A|nr:oligosaccharide flippase family protein [Roseivirga sp. E12]MBO3699086.1 oligosaccharide flippase family protein [Roseivirga sp. E12]